MIDLEREKPISLTQATKKVASRPNLSTVWRWAMKGSNGIKLETVTIGGRRFTSEEALKRFIHKTTAKANGPAEPSRTDAQKRRAIREAMKELEEAGI